MLYRELLNKQLENKKDEFKAYSKQKDNALESYRAKLQRLEKLPLEKIEQMLEFKEAPGAMPSAELDELSSFTKSFKHTWANHEEARRWALEILADRTTFAADGSQISPSRDVSLMVAAVQVGWYENGHTKDGKFEKNAEFFVLSPKDLMPAPQKSRVDEFRIEQEVRKIKDFLHKKEGWQERGERMPLAFYDNTMLVPFPLTNESQSKYRDQMLSLIEVSSKTRVPMLGFISRSFAGDILTLLDTFEIDDAKEEGNPIHDGDMLQSRFLPYWGDRSIFCYSRRHGLIEFFGNNIGFIYLQTTAKAHPARLEMPSWIFHDGLIDEVIDVVRAECVVGLGYPYCLETADQTATIPIGDQPKFYKAIQDFAEKNGFDFEISRKEMSKSRRR